jgi:hypothetical protein
VSKNTALKSTINLPKTSFKMKANLPVKEPRTLEWWDSIDVYSTIRASRADAKPYILHDGPPYGNASIHLGQALNKTLKDFVVKSRSMMGFDARYVPGWDCHGLPIEHRVDKELGERRASMGPLQIRQLSRDYAIKFIDVQRGEFYRLGVFWDRCLDAREERENLPNRKAIYRTIDRSYEAEIIRQLGRFFTKNAVYHGVKPVHWCYSCRTALAEAEVEYIDRVDPSIYVKFPVRALERRVPELAGREVSLVIWTTTPWTLPANLAVALHPSLVYLALDIDGETMIVAEGRAAEVAATLGWNSPTEIARFVGAELVGEGDDWIGTAAPISRPYPATDGPAAGDGVLILGEHVTLDAGTGCVHTAPQDRRRPAQPRSAASLRKPRTQLPALLAMHEPGLVSFDAPVVHLDGRGRPALPGAGADQRDELDPGPGRDPHRPDDRDSTRLVHFTPADLGRSDSRGCLLELHRERPAGVREGSGAVRPPRTTVPRGGLGCLVRQAEWRKRTRSIHLGRGTPRTLGSGYRELPDLRIQCGAVGTRAHR